MDEDKKGGFSGGYVHDIMVRVVTGGAVNAGELKDGGGV